MTEVLQSSALIANAFLGVALVFAIARLVRGPSLPDRVVSLDLIAMLAIAFIAVHTITTGETVYLDVALVLALVTFMGTVAFARYLERRKTP